MALELLRSNANMRIYSGNLPHFCARSNIALAAEFSMKMRHAKKFSMSILHSILIVNGMRCTGRGSAIDNAIGRLHGIQSMHASYEKSRVLASHDEAGHRPCAAYVDTANSSGAQHGREWRNQQTQESIGRGSAEWPSAGGAAHCRLKPVVRSKGLHCWPCSDLALCRRCLASASSPAISQARPFTTWCESPICW